MDIRTAIESQKTCKVVVIRYRNHTYLYDGYPTVVMGGWPILHFVATTRDKNIEILSVTHDDVWSFSREPLVTYTGTKSSDKFFGTDAYGNWILKDAPAASDILEVHFVSTSALSIGANVTWTCDKTYEEIETANEAGTKITAFINGAVAPLISFGLSCISFGFIDSNDNSTFITYSKEIDMGTEDGAEASATYTIISSDKTYVTAPTGILRDGVLTTDSDGYWSMTPRSTFEGMGLTSATVGQIAQIAEVDDNGTPTVWTHVDMPSGYTGPNIPPPWGGDKMIVTEQTGENEFGYTLKQSPTINDFINLGLTSATVGQMIKVKAVSDDGGPTEWEAVDNKDVWEAIGEIDITTDVADGVHSWTFDDLPGYKELVIDRDSLIG